MTCIVGCVEGGITYLGGDSLASNGYSGWINKHSKVFHCKDTDKAVIGYTSSFRMGQLLMFARNLFDELSIVKETIDYEYIVVKFIPALQKIFVDGGFETNNSGQKHSGEFLLGYKDKLYKIQEDYSVLECGDNFDACGCGIDFALGSLQTTRNLCMTPEDRILEALRAASKFSVGVAPPFYIVNTGTNEVKKFEN